MKPGRAPILALFAFAAAVSTVAADDTIVVAAQEVEAAVAPRPVRARVVDLPPLTFELRAAIRCEGSPVSVTLSIADTFVTRTRAELDGQRATEASLTVPASQLAMAANRQFCTEEESADELFAPGFATAHASLQCENESGGSVLFASAPLNLRLSCARPTDASEAGQDPSFDPR
jgi:hypothetical protein